jgi:predicted ATPase
MRVFILNSAPGAGKSSLINQLHSTIKEDFAFFDGDDIGTILPYQLNKRWLNLIHSG